MIKSKKDSCILFVQNFWKYRGLLSYLLSPLTLLYYIGHLINYHIIQRPKKAKPFVICVGNAVVGGTGKTPFALSLGKKLIDLGYSIAFLSRGYESLSQQTEYAVMVTDKMTAKQVGDEALLLSKTAPTYVCKNRYKAALYAAEEGADIVIMDDGMQNNTLAKDFTFLLIDSQNPAGNGFMIPAGPLREPLSIAKKRADCIIMVGSKDKDTESQISANIISTTKPTEKKKYIAFSGIGNPDRFLNILSKYNFDVKDHRFFPDHHHYTNSELDDLLKRAKKQKLKLITTEKDAVKISSKYLKQIEVLEISMKFKMPHALLKAIKSID